LSRPPASGADITGADLPPNLAVAFLAARLLLDATLPTLGRPSRLRLSGLRSVPLPVDICRIGMPELVRRCVLRPGKAEGLLAACAPSPARSSPLWTVRSAFGPEHLLIIDDSGAMGIAGPRRGGERGDGYDISIWLNQHPSRGKEVMTLHLGMRERLRRIRHRWNTDRHPKSRSCSGAGPPGSTVRVAPALVVLNELWW